MASSGRDLKEMIEVITIAIPREIESYNYYKKAAERAESKEAKRLFDFLALQEKGHEQALKKLLSDLKYQSKGKNP